MKLLNNRPAGQWAWNWGLRCAASPLWKQALSLGSTAGVDTLLRLRSEKGLLSQCRECLGLSGLHPDPPVVLALLPPTSSFRLPGCTPRMPCLEYVHPYLLTIPQSLALASSLPGSLPGGLLSFTCTLGSHVHSQGHCLSGMSTQRMCIKHLLCTDHELDQDLRQ